MFVDASSCINLIADFLSKKISGKVFEDAYLKIFKYKIVKQLDSESHTLINSFFLDVDEYCSIPGLNSEDQISEEELRIRAKKLLTKLKKIKSNRLNPNKHFLNLNV